MTIASPTDIANLALDLLSVGNVTNIINPTTATEEKCARWYDQTRRALLRTHPWNFAIKRAKLAASSIAPVFGYSKQYPLPSDFLRLLTVNDGSQEQDVVLSTHQYEMESGGLMISDSLFNSDSALNVRYVYNVEDVSKFDPLFIDLLAYDMALSMAYNMTETNTNIERINGLRRQRAAMAKAIDGQERPPQLVQRSVNRAARRNSGSHVNSHRVIFD